MNVVGLITEYNPFHNGHLYHIEEAKRITGADYVVVIMSGNFLQRGEPAIIDKHHRTRMGLLNGVDLVLELPTIFACSSAEYFASAGIALLDKLGVINYLCFGSECGQIEPLLEIAQVLEEEPVVFKENLQNHLKSGLSFPYARAKALLEYYKTTNPKKDIDSIEKIVSSPNNILGIEYIRAILKRNSNIIPITIKRLSSNYHDKELMKTVIQNKDMTFISSATAIRTELSKENRFETLMKQVPPSVLDIMMEAWHTHFPILEDGFSSLLHYKLITCNQDDLLSYVDVSPVLANRIKNHLPQYTSFSAFCDLIKTKNFTATRIKRVLIHILLDIKQSDMVHSLALDYVPYARILGFRKSCSFLLHEIKKKATIPLISKLTKASDLLSPNSLAVLEIDIKSANIYQAVVLSSYKLKTYNEYTQEIIIID